MTGFQAGVVMAGQIAILVAVLMACYIVIIRRTKQIAAHSIKVTIITKDDKVDSIIVPVSGKGNISFTYPPDTGFFIFKKRNNGEAHTWVYDSSYIRQGSWGLLPFKSLEEKIPEVFWEVGSLIPCLPRGGKHSMNLLYWPNKKDENGENLISYLTSSVFAGVVNDAYQEAGMKASNEFQQASKAINPIVLYITLGLMVMAMVTLGYFTYDVWNTVRIIVATIGG